jgi:hypothetical protein
MWTKINISFSDFWEGFDPNNNFFSDLFKSLYDECCIVPFSNKHTDVLIYSCFGNQHYSADTNKIKKIFYTKENKRPNYKECNYSMTFDLEYHGARNIRLPSWMLHIDWFGKNSYENSKFLIPLSELRHNTFLNRTKTGFCCIIADDVDSNTIEILEKLSKYKDVHCYGDPFGTNIKIKDTKNKFDIMSNYKFNVCFENAIRPGYYTEKLVHAKVAGCVPLYWADKNCKHDFNSDSFLNGNNFSNVDKYVEKIIELDNNEEEYNIISSAYLFEGKEPSLDFIKEKLKNMLWYRFWNLVL